MSRQTELATVYRQLTAILMRMLLVGAYEAAREIEKAMTGIYTMYRQEVEAAARERAK